MKSMSSYDSIFWSAQAEVAKMEQEKLEVHSRVRFYQLAEQTGREVSQEDWYIMEEAKQLLGQSNAYRV
jgi:hypothetical protein